MFVLNAFSNCFGSVRVRHKKTLKQAICLEYNYFSIQAGSCANRECVFFNDQFMSHFIKSLMPTFISIVIFDALNESLLFTKPFIYSCFFFIFLIHKLHFT